MKLSELNRLPLVMSRPNLEILRSAGGVSPKPYKFVTTSIGAVNQQSHAARKAKIPRIIRSMISENSNVCLLSPMSIQQSSNAAPQSAGLIGKWKCLFGFWRFCPDVQNSAWHLTLSGEQIQMSGHHRPGFARQCQCLCGNFKFWEA
jgi:hypothetical protein